MLEKYQDFLKRIGKMAKLEELSQELIAHFKGEENDRIQLSKANSDQEEKEARRVMDNRLKQRESLYIPKEYIEEVCR